jgi:hypothetical protein
LGVNRFLLFVGRAKLLVRERVQRGSTGLDIFDAGARHTLFALISGTSLATGADWNPRGHLMIPPISNGIDLN